MDGIEFWNLQGGSAAEEANGLPIRDATDEYGDGLLPLTSVIAQLDLVITVDTLAAHLAGALGTPAWVMLQYAADWRWMTGRSDSPWYPSLRLFRQSQPGDWRRVVEDILTALKHSTRETLSL
jgi:ADP-heptose:LPS heptosyltransferase